MGLIDWFKSLDDPSEPLAPVVPAAPTPADINTALTQVESLVAQSHVHTAISFRTGRITARLRETLPRMDTTGFTSSDHYSLIATATNYLPETLSHYLRLPRDWADSRPIDRGRTSLLVLVDQLDLLWDTVDGIYDAILRRDAEALVAQGRFLAERFDPSRAASVASTPAPAPAPAPSTSAGLLDLGDL
ncbi:MAG: hypothetical protein LBM23_07525 [Propionibacteriaceae bacterium]|nr:hypothetical protein [Propionibacteriaceae bacterium]